MRINLFILAISEAKKNWNEMSEGISRILNFRVKFIRIWESVSMKIENVNVLVIKSEIKKCKNNMGYLRIETINIQTAEKFIILSKNLELMKEIKHMTKYKLNLNLQHGKRGLVLVLDSIGEEIGAI